MAEQSGNLWGQIQLETWRDTPCSPGRTANEGDVQKGGLYFMLKAHRKPQTFRCHVVLCSMKKGAGSCL
jgi:hypothetical protein